MNVVTYDIPNWGDWIIIGMLITAAVLNLVMAYARIEARKGMPLVARAAAGIGMLIVAGGWLTIMLETAVLHARATTEVGVMIWCIGSVCGNWIKLWETWSDAPDTDQLKEWQP